MYAPVGSANYCEDTINQSILRSASFGAVIYGKYIFVDSSFHSV